MNNAAKLLIFNGKSKILYIKNYKRTKLILKIVYN